MRFHWLDPAPVIAGAGVLTPAERASQVPSSALDTLGDRQQQLRRMDRHGLLGLAAAHQALAEAGVRPQGPGDRAWGLVLGSDLGCWGSNARYFLDLLEKAAQDLSPGLFARTVPNAVNGEISIAYQIGGVTETFVSGWTAGAESLIAAAAHLAAGRAVWVLAGGVEAPEPPQQEMHAALRQDSALDWLPPVLAEAAALVLLAAPRVADRSGSSPARLLAYWQGCDATEEFSVRSALDALGSAVVEAVILANSVPPRLAVRWRADASGREWISLPERSGETGAAGAAIAAALVARRGADAPKSALILARGVEGGMAALLVAR